MIRLFLSLLLTLSLAFTSLTMAQARGAAAATGQIEICSGAHATIVYVDAQGQPTKAPHVCPDCLIVLAPGEAHHPLIPIHAVLPAPAPDRLSACNVPHPSGVTPPSRAPPLSV